MSEQNKKLLMLISEIQAISQSGLTFNNSGFEKERYLRLTEISAELAAICSNQPQNFINEIFLLEKGYATPKVDVRSFVLKDDKILLVKERADGLWTLPGGFADVAETPSEAVIRETKEESGYHVTPIKLLAVWDKMKHDHPLHWPHIYKLFFHCEFISGSAHENLEISEIDFFAIDNIPPLSTPRVTKQQLLKLYQLVKSPENTLFD